jgi:hypothetical protein
MIGLKIYYSSIFELEVLLLSSKQGIFIRVIGYFERVQGKFIAFASFKLRKPITKGRGDLF